jgi:4-amino-4-deoxy-L-arabinose transferase-like glycosyltransferase
MSLDESASRTTESIARQLDRHRPLILTALTAGWLLPLVIMAQGRPFWHDEVYTALVSRLPFSTMWRAYLDAIDLSPPLNTMLTRPIHLLVGEGPVATRLPAMLGYVMTSLVLFAFVGRRTNVLMGLAAALLPAATVAWDYAQEARGYGITMACFACALYGWSEAAAGRRPRAHSVLMSVALAAGMWAHYYFVFAFVPISLGELARQAARRRFEWRPWLAIAGACVAVVPLLPLAAVAWSQRTTFWAYPQTLGFGNTYGFLLGRLAGGPRLRIAAFAALDFTAAGAAAVHVLRPSSPRRLATHDLLACLLCLLVPAAGVLLGSWIHVFTDRYAAYAIVGLLAAMPLLLWSISPANRMVESVVLLATLVFAMSIVREGLATRRPSHDRPSRRPILTERVKGGEDVVVVGGIDYLPVWYYSPLDVQPRLKYLADPEGQLEMTGNDTLDRGYLALSRWLPLPIVPAAEFGRTHQQFFLYAPGDDDRWTWGPIGHWRPIVTYVGRDEGGRLYEIQVPPR